METSPFWGFAELDLSLIELHLRFTNLNNTFAKALQCLVRYRATLSSLACCETGVLEAPVKCPSFLGTRKIPMTFYARDNSAVYA